MSPHRVRTISRSPVSRFSRTIAWNVCDANVLTRSERSGMTEPWIAKSSAILQQILCVRGKRRGFSLCPFLCPCSFKIDRSGAQRIAIRGVPLGA